MPSFNKVIMMGNLTRDPVLKYLPNNMACCEFGLATNHKRKEGEDEVCFVDVTAFGKQGEAINQYLSKGKPVLIEGRLKYDTWTSQEGQKRSKHVVIMDRFSFVGSKDDAKGVQHSAPTPAGEPPPPTGGQIPF